MTCDFDKPQKVLFHNPKAFNILLGHTQEHKFCIPTKTRPNRVQKEERNKKSRPFGHNSQIISCECHRFNETPIFGFGLHYCTGVYGSNGRDRVTLTNFEKLATEAELRVTGANLGNLGRTPCGPATIVLEIDEEPVKVAEEAEAVTSIDPNDDLYVGPSEDTAVPLQHIIQESLSLDIPAASLSGNEAFCVAADKVVRQRYPVLRWLASVGQLAAGPSLRVMPRKLGNIFGPRYALPLLPYTLVQFLGVGREFCGLQEDNVVPYLTSLYTVNIIQQ
ncbi:hypothetical protein DFH07DRAFT_781666 [Mycena maculata]|uniref:Uncharacterized protein n=1 Tax=Mycena maculata TaxID=230809 RepID=A0AAD7HY00_9AGAR|nr:hypothetical protein DFH07DRAFT_781666 [Mycena maculata]